MHYRERISTVSGPAPGPPIVLASASPRRRELIAHLGLSAEAIQADIDETRSWELPPDLVVRELASEKARAVYRTRHATLVIGADTTVFLDGKRLEKPADADHAHAMLGRICGKTHRVYTGIAVVSDQVERSDVVVSHVTMHDASTDEITAYVATGESLDKAGAYGIQSEQSLVASVNGCYTNVVGLPLCALALLVARSGHAVDVVAPPCGYRTNRRCPHPIWHRGDAITDRCSDG